MSEQEFSEHMTDWKTAHPELADAEVVAGFVHSLMHRMEYLESVIAELVRESAAAG